MRPYRLAVVVALLGAGCAGSEQPPASGPAPPTETAPPATPSAPESASPGPTSHSPPEAPAAPTYVQIDAIDVSTDIVDLGLQNDGSMEVPADPDEAGWYEQGGRPGGQGPSVIAGHVDSTTGPAVFYRLRDLEAGDTVEIGRADGTTVAYEVERTEKYDQDTFPTVDVFGATSGDELRLITCHGEYDDGYAENLVVYARP